MSLTEAFLTEAGDMRGLEAASNRVREDYGAGAAPTVALINETFTGTNGAPWPTTYFNLVSSNGTRSTIQNNKGQMITDVGGFAQETFWLTEGPDDFYLTFDLSIASNANGGYAQVQYRQNTGGGGGFPRSIIELEMTGGFLAFSNPGGTGAVTVTPPAIASGDIIHWKVRVKGGVHQIKIWLNSTPEPSTWTIDALDTAPTGLTGAAETCIILKTAGAGDAKTYTVDNIVLYDTADPVFPRPPLTPLFTDDFNRADASEPGYYPWIPFDFGGLPLVNNKVTTGWAGTDIRSGARAAIPISDNQWAEADLESNAYGVMGVTTRYGAEDTQYYAMLEYNGGAPRIGMWKRIPGYNYIQLGSYVSVASAVARVRLETFGSTHRVYYNNVLVITQVDATYTTGYPAIIGYNTTYPGGKPTADNFACGELTS